MKPAIITLALMMAACGSDRAPTITTPTILPADIRIEPNTQVTVSLCSFGNCFFQGQARNFGSGCASNIRGVTVSRSAGNSQQFGAAQWSYSARVRPNELFIYSGVSLPVPSGEWTYQTTFSWDSVPCS